MSSLQRAVGAAGALARRAADLRARAISGARHDFDCVYRSLHARLVALHGRIEPLRLLDFGCGTTYPLVVLFDGQVREVTGLDVAPVFRDGWPELARWCGGWKRPGTALEACLRHQEARFYFRELERRFGRRVRHRAYRLVRYGGAEMPFPDASFDGIVSNAVLQELPEPLEAFAREMHRVLEPGGTIDLAWHSFYSWSGHYLGEAESRRSAWGHLRGGPFHPSLNRVTPDRVREAFRPFFTELRLLAHDRQHRIRDLDPDYTPEGEEHLTSDLEAELSAYPREWLLARGWVLQGRRP